MSIRKKSNVSKINNFLIVFTLFILIKQIRNECPKDAPILKDGNCLVQYCTAEEFKKRKCIINNAIIKTQWLNNIITISDNNYRYVNIATYSNRDMIIETTSDQYNSKRMFYGIKSNGRPFFDYLETESYIWSIEVNETNHYRYESEIFVAKIYDNEEHLFSISKTNSYAEIYNFDNKTITKKYISELSNQMDGLRGTIFNYNQNNNIVFGFTKGDYIYIKTLTTLIDSNSGINKVIIELRNNTNINIGDSISCFVTSQPKIICFYLCRIIYRHYYDDVHYNDNYKYYGCIIALKNSLNNFQILKYIDNSIYIDKSSFLKCIHLKENIGAFIYYKKIYINYIYPVILLGEYNGQLLTLKMNLTWINI